MKRIELGETEQNLLNACNQYKEACKSASEAMVLAMQEAMDDGMDRDEIKELCVVRGQLAPSTVVKLLSIAGTSSGRRMRKASKRLGKDAQAFFSYVLKYRNGHVPSKKELRSWCLAVSRQLKK